MSARRLLSRSPIIKTPAEALGELIAKHYGPGPHPSGSPQKVHGLGGGIGAQYEENREVNPETGQIGVHTPGGISVDVLPNGKWFVSVHRSWGASFDVELEGTGGEEAAIEALKQAMEQQGAPASRAPQSDQNMSSEKLDEVVDGIERFATPERVAVLREVIEGGSGFYEIDGYEIEYQDEGDNFLFQAFGEGGGNEFFVSFDRVNPPPEAIFEGMLATLESADTGRSYNDLRWNEDFPEWALGGDVDAANVRDLVDSATIPEPFRQAFEESGEDILFSDALENYTFNSVLINNSMRGVTIPGYEGRMDAFDHYIPEIDALMRPTTADAVVYRGLKAEYLGDVQVGDVISDGAFMSTTPSLEVAQGFSQGEDLSGQLGDDAAGVILKIALPAGTPMVPIFSTGTFGENEVLLDNDAQLRVDSIKDGTYSVTLLSTSDFQKKRVRKGRKPIKLKPILERWAEDTPRFEKVVAKHDGPGPHESGSEQTVHAPRTAFARGESGGEGQMDDMNQRSLASVADHSDARVNAPQVATLANQMYEQAVENEADLTATIAPIVEQTDGEFHGFEHRVKYEGAIRSKIVRTMDEDGHSTPAAAAANIRDLNRYTVAWDPDDQWDDKYLSVKEALSDSGWFLFDEKEKNYWADGNTYNGLNVQFTNGTSFVEVQFHTPQSLGIKDTAHEIYSIIRELPVGDPARTEGAQKLFELWNSDRSHVPVEHYEVGIEATQLFKSSPDIRYFARSDTEEFDPILLYRQNHDLSLDVWRGDDTWEPSLITVPEVHGMGGSTDYYEVEVEGVDRLLEGAISANVEVAKVHPYEDLVFGWANVSIRKDGTEIVDHQGHIVPIEELESAAYNFTVQRFGSGDMHKSEDFGELVESMVFTKEKVDAMGLTGQVPLGWWVGFKLPSEEAQKAREGKRRMFSIEGTARLEPVN